jgi:hypothetical protein
MREELVEQALVKAFRGGFGLSDADRDALWERFTARLEREARAWAWFVVVMARTTAGLRADALKLSWASQRSRLG